MNKLYRCFFIICCILCGNVLCCAQVDQDFNGLNWVWYPGNTNASVSADPGKYYFRHSFGVPLNNDLLRAFLLVAVDNSCIVHLNGEECGFANQWGAIERIPLKRHIRPGNNLIAIEAENAGPGLSPAGIIGKIVIQYKNAESEIIPIDNKWKTSGDYQKQWKQHSFDDADWKKAEAVSPFGLGPWGRIGQEQQAVPKDFPAFSVPGHDEELKLLRHLFYSFYGTGTGGTLWDGWIVKSTIWPGGKSAEMIRRNHSKMLASRIMDDEGYVSCHQHKGLAHNLGWPFPLWTQSGGIGWHFSVFGLPYGSLFGVHKSTSTDGWDFDNVKEHSINNDGLRLALGANSAAVTTPKFSIDSFISPFIALEWESGNLNRSAVCSLEWTTDKDTHFSKDRRIYFNVPDPDSPDSFTMIPVYKLSAWKGKITQLRFRFEDIESSSIIIKKIYTSVDSRHNINNFCYLQGCLDYLNWTGDMVFLRENIQKMRHALKYSLHEFQVEKYKCVCTPWVGHDGRSGIEKDKEGNKTIHPGRGIGNNYWDLLPAGGRDTTATIYLYDVLTGMAELEKAIKANPQWNIPSGHLSFNPDYLLTLSREIKEYSNRALWNRQTGRYYMATDIDGKSYDYGFTFLNLEAVYYDFATDSQARSILDWISGKRMVPDDTSQGRDIYHWVFSQRSTTKRNLDYYSFVWPEPENIEWGQQVQDGGAVLGFSYFDIMSRLKVYGPDNAWQRLKQIIEWYKEVRGEGGFREYYSKPGRGSLQGGGTAGGLGIDEEFAESVLVPQVMIYGFMGIEPHLDRLSVKPKLPDDWPSLKIGNIYYNGSVFDLTANKNSLLIALKETCNNTMTVELTPGNWKKIYYDPQGDKKFEHNIKTDKSAPTTVLTFNKGCSIKFIRSNSD